MHPKKQSKKNKPKQQENFHSPIPIRQVNDTEVGGFNLRDLSPLPRSYGSHHQVSNVYLSNTQLTIIQTPANVPVTHSYLEQIDERNNTICGVIIWGNQGDLSEISYGQESDILEISQSQLQEEEQKKAQNQQMNKKYEQKDIGHNLRTAQPKQKKDQQRKLFHSSSSVSSTKKVTCNCKKTKCLKLYCDCFRINQSCDGCNCVGCHNLPIYEQQRNNAMLTLMDRNPQAFKPKIDQQQHAKGCHCRKSNCSKKYCECFQAGLKCGSNCKCEQCKNCADPDDNNNGNNGANELTINIQSLLSQQKEKRQDQKVQIKFNSLKKQKKLQIQLSRA